MISDIISFLLKNVLKYRLKVIQTNINHCLGETLDKTQQKEIISRFYTNFSDIILESIKGLSYNPRKLVPRFKVVNLEMLDQHFDNNQNVIIYSQHFNNWEWGPITLGLQMKHHVVGIVKVISNDYIDDYMIKTRPKTNVTVVPTVKTHKYFAKLHTIEDPQAIFFIADQSPHGKERKTSVNFFGHPTAFHHGAAIFAARSKYPIYTLDVSRVSRGRYHTKLHQLSPGNEGLSPEEITTRYADHLQQLIQSDPEAWLWSHKRFKNSLKY